MPPIHSIKKIARLNHFSKIYLNNTRSLCSRTSKKNGPVKLSYTTFEPDRPPEPRPLSPLIILHGLLGSKRNWQAIAKALCTRSGRQVITVDARNHGDSPHADEMNYHVMCEDLQELLCDQNIEKAVLLGHSMGGRLAMTLALTDPDVIDGLIVEDVTPSPNDETRGTPPSFLVAMKNFEFDNTLPQIADVRQLAENYLKSTVKALHERQFILTNIIQDGNQYRWTTNIDAILANFDKLSCLPAFTSSYFGDTLFIGGARSNYIKDYDMPMIKQYFPEAYVTFIEHAGHWVHFDQPAEFMDLVLDFLLANSLQ